MDEVEVKYRLSGAAAHDQLRARLLGIGAERRKTEHEQNVLFDDAVRSLAAAGAVLRVRTLDGGPRARLTFKGAATFDGTVKRREEIETGVDDGATLEALLRVLGLEPTVEYEKDRETWQIEEVEVALDTLAFGYFCEIEGEAAGIRRVAARLGLDDSQAEPAGYPTLTLLHQEAGRRKREQE
jgi:predicted adenylyl cyclase CyaB